MFPDRMAAGAGLRGIVVREVVEGSGAAAAGIRPAERDPRTGRTLPGDVIVAVDGKPVRTQIDLLDALDGKAIGDEVEVTVLRDGSETDLTVTLKNLSED